MICATRIDPRCFRPDDWALSLTSRKLSVRAVHHLSRYIYSSPSNAAVSVHLLGRCGTDRVWASETGLKR
jgi:hypothetical protein